MRRSRLFSTIQLVLAFIGAGIAGLLYWAHKADVDLPCTSGNACDLVWASHWSHIAGIPLSLIGFLAYSTLAVLAVSKLNSEGSFTDKLRAVMLVLASGGVCYSWYLQYVSHVFIGVICPYCMTSAITMTLMFLSLVIETTGQTNSASQAPVPT